MLAATIAMLIIALVLVGFAWARHVHVEGLWLGLRMFASIVPLLIAVFAIAGLVEVLVPKERVAGLLGDQAGFKGIILGSLAGAVTPGGPYVSFPLVATIYHAGAGIGTIVAFVTAWSLWAVARLPMEIGIVGPRVTLARIVSTFVFPPIAGVIARTFFSNFVR